MKVTFEAQLDTEQFGEMMGEVPIVAGDEPCGYGSRTTVHYGLLDVTVEHETCSGNAWAVALYSDGRLVVTYAGSRAGFHAGFRYGDIKRIHGKNVFILCNVGVPVQLVSYETSRPDWSLWDKLEFREWDDEITTGFPPSEYDSLVELELAFG